MSDNIATVIKVIDEYTLEINKGSKNGISEGQLFLVYYLDDEEMFDPDTNESLGHIEIIVGKGKATHVQEKMSTIISVETERTDERKIVRTNNLLSFYGATGPSEETIIPSTRRLPFKSPSKGCKAKPI